MTLAIVCITPNIPGSISWRAVLTVDRLSELVNQITDTLVEMQNGDEVEEWWFARENDWNEDSFFFFYFRLVKYLIIPRGESVSIFMKFYE